jgi:hypothetical protein
VAHPHTPSTPSPMQQVVSLSQSSYASPVEPTDRRGGDGVGVEPNHTTTRKLENHHSILSVSDHSYTADEENRTSPTCILYIQSIFRRGYTVLILYVYLTYKCVSVTNPATRP